MPERSHTYRPKPQLTDRIIEVRTGMEHPYPALPSTSTHLNKMQIEEYRTR